MKVAATKGYGAEVVFYDRYKEDRDAISRRLAAESGATLIPPYDHPDVIAGQGTAALELCEEVGELDLLVTPLGGGGLLAGSALAVRAMSPDCSIVGVEPEAGNDGQQSLRQGRGGAHPDPKIHRRRRADALARRSQLPDHQKPRSSASSPYRTRS